MPYSIKSIEALDQAEGPFLRLLDLTAALFECRLSVVSLMTPTEVIMRTSSHLCAERMERNQCLAAGLAQMPTDTVFVVRDEDQNPKFNTHPLVNGPVKAKLIASAPITGGSGKVIGALSVVYNTEGVSFGKRQIQELRMLAGMADDIIAGIEAARIRDERIESLKLVEQMSGVGQWRLVRETGELEWSDVVYQIHGVDRESFRPTGKASLDFFLPDDRQRLAGLMKRTLATGEGYVAKLKMRNAKGEVRYLETRAAAELDDRGKVSAIYGVVQDITEQDRLLLQSQKSEARYRLLAENVGDVLTRVKQDGSSKYISPAIQQVLGWTYEDMSGQSMDYVYPEDRPLVMERIREAVVTGEPVMQEFRAVHRKGHVVWVECTFRAVRGDSGMMDDVIVVIRDASLRKGLEEEVIEAKERAEKAAAAKSEFLANMSHELRTPLTSVIGFSGLLLKSTALLERERLYAERIATASDALLEVINDILDYSKLEANAIELDPVAFDLRGLAEGTVAMLEGQCASKSLGLSLHVEEDLPLIFSGDVGRLRQVMLNFLSNAVKFTAKGEVKLSVLGWPVEPGLWTVRVEVTDTGIGIPHDKLPQLFDRFTQADASTTRLYGGTGLGLAISQRLITIMGGKIGVESRPGQGSTFWFEVPLAQMEQAERHEAQLESQVGLERSRILMADDAPANRELVTAILGGLGLEVHTVKDGAEAVQALQDASYDLVLMDVHMPVMDGLAATQEIRRMERETGARTPILALTANVQGDQIRRCLDCGMDGHLAKPVQIPELVGALSHWLAMGQAKTACRAEERG